MQYFNFRQCATQQSASNQILFNSQRNNAHTIKYFFSSQRNKAQKGFIFLEA